MSLAGAVASLAGILIYNTCLKRVPLRPMLVWCTLLAAVLGSTDLVLVSGLNRRLGISDEVRGFSLLNGPWSMWSEILPLNVRFLGKNPLDLLSHPVKYTLLSQVFVLGDDVIVSTVYEVAM